MQIFRAVKGELASVGYMPLPLNQKRRVCKSSLFFRQPGYNVGKNVSNVNGGNHHCYKKGSTAEERYLPWKSVAFFPFGIYFWILTTC